ncbi:MAG: epoxide hydrolase family protein [Pseudomonadota bacterium]
MQTGRIRPFTVNVPQVALDDLVARLAHTRLPEQETVDDWDQGVPLTVVQDFLDYWCDHYDWRHCEEELNHYPNFRMRIDDLPIHFLHIRSPHDNARPLLLTHGWPGSVLEFMDVIEPLTKPDEHGGSAEQAFHLIVPSLPGYGFSGKPRKAGWDIPKIAKAWDVLMRALGYERYFAQGGDWGSAVTLEMARQDRGALAAVHSNMVLAAPDPETISKPTEAEAAALARLQWYREKDHGYAEIQRTRPQTIGYALTDSPVGQMAWILEKFRNWSDAGDDIASAFGHDRLLDNISLYWFTRSAASSARLYWHSFGKMEMAPIAMPMGGTIFPKELFQTSQRWAEKRFSNIIHWNVAEKGGHFAAFETPDIFVEEIRTCFDKAELSCARKVQTA